MPLTSLKSYYSFLKAGPLPKTRKQLFKFKKNNFVLAVSTSFVKKLTNKNDKSVFFDTSIK